MMRALIKALAKYQVRNCKVLLISGLATLLPLYSGFSNLAWAYEPSTENPTGTPTEVAPTPCQPIRSAQAGGLTRFVNDVTQTATLIEQPAIGMGTLLEQVAPQMLAYLNASPFPEINQRARLARVPVIMYHDILPEKKVFFDVTPEEFEQRLKLIQQKGLTPISMDQLVTHLRTGLPLPEKPILLTFDDGYSGHYEYVYPLLKKYNYPALFAIYTAKVGKQMGRSSLTWEQLREMAKDPLITISSHSVSHKVMEGLTPDELAIETQESKRLLEMELGVPIRYFTYPEGKYDTQAVEAVKQAGYAAALTMDDNNEKLAGQSDNLFAIGRVGQSRLAEMVDVVWGGPKLPAFSQAFDFSSPVVRTNTTVDNTPFIFISGGKPMTIHAKTRDQVPKILEGTEAIAAVDGGFFSLEFLDSNAMLGPVLSQSEGEFIPGKRGEIPFLAKRPLVLIGPKSVKFVPFDYIKHNTLEGIQAEMPDVTDAFVAAGWLVENEQPQPIERFGRLYSVNELRHRAFWGINQAGQPQIGVSQEPIGSVDLGAALAKAGFRDAVMLDSGASTSLAYKGASLVGYTPRPVPHVVALVPPAGALNASCALVSSR
ncbi:polysaccharide deacetylase [Stenomitos frigidus ULC18]|uniref:Polysaccharide deacetylase n=2 Tax=Stenomitos TaxID=1844270 RepID=A0A2T1EGU6_9CYAN|nr:polysaccharide deacetylase [Stenomitos frigidus ULC18]